MTFVYIYILFNLFYVYIFFLLMYAKLFTDGNQGK
jgi:hypothetical protein